MLYSGSEVIKSIADNSGLNTHGKYLFYSTNPEVVSANTLYKKCPYETKQGIEFGCYLPDESKIYILKVPTSEYTDIQYTTVAHETLHVAWDKLDSIKRETITNLLRLIYNDKTNFVAKDLRKKLKSYGKDKDVINNELHSFLGSEFNLEAVDSRLADYYSKFFSEQSAPAEANVRFNDTIAGDRAVLDSTRRALEGELSALNRYKTQRLDIFQPYLDRARYYGDTYNYNVNVGRYNKTLAYYNNMVDTYNVNRRSFNSDVASFNAILRAFYPSKSQLKTIN